VARVAAMVATIRLPEVRLASASTAGAGDGRVWLGPAAVRDLGVQLGDPILVDVFRVGVGGGGAPSTSDDTDSWPRRFLATAAPTPVQRDNAVAGAVSSADEAVILDPTTRLVVPMESADGDIESQFLPRESNPTATNDAATSVRFEGSARALLHNGEVFKPPLCVLVTLHAPQFTHTHGAAESTRKLLVNRLVTAGCQICLDANAGNASNSIVVTRVTPNDVPCVRIGPNTTITFGDLNDENDSGSIPKKDTQPLQVKACTKIAGATDVLQTLREAISWPILYGDDADDLGVTFPRGVLLHGPPGVGKTASVVAVAAEAGAVVLTLSAGDVFGPYAGDAEAKLRKTFREAELVCSKQNVPCVILLDEIDAMCPARGTDTGLSGSRVVAQLLTLMDDGGSCEVSTKNDPKNKTKPNSKLKPVIVATTNRPNAVDPALRRPGRFDLEVEIPLPSRTQREAILAVQSKGLPLSGDVSLHEIAAGAKGYSGADLAALCREAAMAAIRETAATGDEISKAEEDSSSGKEEPDPNKKEETTMSVTARHFALALTKVGASVTRGAALELTPTTWADVGGLHDVKRRLQQAVEWPLKHAKSFDRLGLAPPRGVLLHGPPGCAKTTLARAAANASGATVISLSAADVFSKYVGEGERLLRDAFAKARKAAPSILLLDEIDGMVGNRGDAGGEGGAAGGNDVAARVLSAFLVEMDGLEVSSGERDTSDDGADAYSSRDSNVLVVATTNRPENLDTALMRPGRLDMCLYVPPPDLAGREEALKVHARGVPLAKDVDLRRCAEQTERFTGAELLFVIREAALAALRENMDATEVTNAHIKNVLKTAKPALTENDLAKWASFRA
tara:strand:- start:171 stop:2726 length:2556 start_codon:yes stop_codon:yes gene_type:complete